jgi:hypothetical protein
LSISFAYPLFKVVFTPHLRFVCSRENKPRQLATSSGVYGKVYASVVNRTVNDAN